MSDTPKACTHTAYTRQRLGKKPGPWLEIGNGRIEGDIMHVFLDRTTIGGFFGYVRLVPYGEPPPLPQPQRPAQHEDENESDPA